MRLWEIEEVLQEVDSFKKPKVKLEQYITTPHIASHFLYTASNSYGDIENKTVLDLGTGTGMLAIGASLLGASYVTAIDIDEEAIEIAQENLENCEVENIEFILGDITNFKKFFKQRRFFDTVIMNPPFGTKVKGLDMKFLEIAMDISNIIYSLHKTSTRDYILKKSDRLGFKAKVIAELKYDLPKTYQFHKKDSKDIQIDLIRFQKIEDQKQKK